MKLLFDFLDDEGKILKMVMIDGVFWLQNMIVVGGLVVFDSVVLLVPSEMVAPLIVIDNLEHFLFLGEGDEIICIVKT